MKRIFSIVFLFLLLFSSQNILAQVSVKASIDSSLILIGEQSHLIFEVTQPSDVQVRFPLFSDTLQQGILIVQRSKPDTVKLEHNRLKITQALTITSFDTALYYIPPIKFAAGKDTVQSAALSLKVISYPIDTTTETIKDIKKIYPPPFDWRHFFFIVGLIMLIIIIIALIAFILWKYVFKKPSPFIAQTKPKLPPYQVALNELDRIQKLKLWQQGREKDYYTQLTDTIRTYIQDRFNITTKEKTSSEILEDTEVLQTEYNAAYDSLKKLLQLGDLVKFAKWRPLSEENELSINICYLFVNQTREIQQSAEEETIEKPQNDSAAHESSVKNKAH
jgi:hypothetical protein